MQVGTPCHLIASTPHHRPIRPTPCRQPITEDLFRKTSMQSYLTENPWPIGLVSGALLLIFIALFLRSGELRTLVAALIALACLSGVLLLDFLITTPAEHGETVVRAMVSSAEAGDPDGLLEHLSNEASLHMGDVRKPGRSFSDLKRSLMTLERANRITDNWVTRLDGVTMAADRAEVSLACITTTTSSYGSVPTTWMFELEKQSDGRWLVTRVVFESIMGETPARPI